MVEYLELLIQKGVEPLLYAVDYFSKAFGFDPTGSVWFRPKIVHTPLRNLQKTLWLV